MESSVNEDAAYSDASSGDLEERHNFVEEDFQKRPTSASTTQLSSQKMSATANLPQSSTVQEIKANEAEVLFPLFYTLQVGAQKFNGSHRNHRQLVQSVFNPTRKRLFLTVVSMLFALVAFLHGQIGFDLMNYNFIMRKTVFSNPFPAHM
jgi:hypothetical protein